MDIIPATLDEAAAKIRDGDLLLFRRWGLIAIAGRSVYSHAAKLAWWHDDLMVLETLQWHGGRCVTLSSQVKPYPGRWDVYRANPENRWPEYDRVGSTRLMRQMCGHDYGYGAVVTAALMHLPVVRCFVTPNMDDEAVDRRPPFCSQACAYADRVGGGVDPVEHLADRLTEPADLARSPFYEYQFTLTG